MSDREIIGRIASQAEINTYLGFIGALHFLAAGFLISSSMFYAMIFPPVHFQTRVAVFILLVLSLVLLALGVHVQIEIYKMTKASRYLDW